MSSNILEEILWAIADVRGVDPEDLDLVLHDYIDIDAIRGLLEQSSSDWTLEFSVQNHSVTVMGDGVVLVDDG